MNSPGTSGFLGLQGLVPSSLLNDPNVWSEQLRAEGNAQRLCRGWLQVSLSCRLEIQLIAGAWPWLSGKRRAWKFWVVIFARHLCFVLLPVTRLIGDQKSWSCSDYRLNSKRSSGGEGNQLAMDRALGSWDSVTNGNGVHSTQT